MGIWRDIYLSFYDDMRISDVRILQKHDWKDYPSMGTVSQAEYLRLVEASDTVTLSVETELESKRREYAGCTVEVKLYEPEEEQSARQAGSGTYAKNDAQQGESRTYAENSAQQGESRADAKTAEPVQCCSMAAAESCSCTFLIRQPRLWWTNGLGGHPLYRLEISLRDASGAVLESKEYSIGLRELHVSTKKDEWGSEFAFVLNGVKLFAMGADYIPEDCIYPWITKERIEHLIRSSVLANYNMLRIWGGGYYPSDTFYDLCDRNGLLVWQDLMYACNIYDFTEEFEENIRQETIDNVRRLRHHASLALWCGNNEMETAWMHWGIGETHSPALKADYIKQFEYVLPKVIREEDGQAFYWPSSPSSGGSFDEAGSFDRGDCHYWEVWHGMKPFTEYRKHYFRFCSEFGFESFPERKTIDTFALPEDCNIFSPVMESHQKNGTANGKILSYISENFRYPRDFDSLLYVSQILQGMAIKAGVDHWRANRGRCMGALYWQINDNWPVASWSSIDYFGRWKALHYMAARFFAPKAGSIRIEGSEASVYAANETLEQTSVSVTVRVRDMQFGILSEETAVVTVPPQTSVCVCERDFEQVICGRERSVYLEAHFEWEDETATTECETFVPYKHLELPKPKLSARVSETGGVIRICVSSDCFAPFVWLELPDDVIFSDNCFHLTDPESTEICIYPENILSGRKIRPKDVENSLKMVSLRDLYE